MPSFQFPENARVISFGPYDLVARLYIITRETRSGYIYKKVARFMQKFWIYSTFRMGAVNMRLKRDEWFSQSLRDTKLPDNIKRELQTIHQKVMQQEFRLQESYSYFQ